MANFKRRGPKSTRAGCLLCKPHKRQGSPKKNRDTFASHRNSTIAREKVLDAEKAFVSGKQ